MNLHGIKFEDREREIGQRLFEDAHVALEAPENEGFHEACVTNFRTGFWIWVSFENGSMEHECDCPLFEDDGIGCEHLFALLLTIGTGEEVEESENASDPELQLSYCLLGEESEAAMAPVFQLMDDNRHVVAMTPENWQRLDDPSDIEALNALGRACGGMRSAREGGGFLRSSGPFTPPADGADSITQKILKTGRLFYRQAQGSSIQGPLRPATTGQESFQLRVRQVTETHSELSAELVDGTGRCRQAADADMLISSQVGLVLRGRLLARIDTAGASDMLKELRAEGPRRVRSEQVEPLLSDLGTKQPLPPVLMEGSQAQPAATGVACFGVIHVNRRADLTSLRLVFKYGSLEIPVDSNATLPFDPTIGRQIARDLADETRLLEQIVRAGASPDSDIAGLFWIDTNELSNLASELDPDHFHMLIGRRPLRSSGDFNIDISSGDSILKIAVKLHGQAAPQTLSSLLASWRTGRDFVVLDDGSALVPGESLTEKLDRLLQLEDLAALETGEHLEFPSAAALMVDSLLSEEMATRDAGFETTVRSLEDVGEHTAIDIDTLGINATLRPYQEAGVSFLNRLGQLGLGGCLADDMGLGKTLQVLTHLRHRSLESPEARHLIVVPRSLIFNWRQEAATFAPALKIYTYHGSGRSLPKETGGCAILTTYGVIRRDAEKLSAHSFDVCVFDEAQALKNPAAQTTRAAARLVARQKLALTGTPMENRVGDLWSLMDITNPGLFGSKLGLDRLDLSDEAARSAIRRALRPVLLRRTKQEVLPDLPPLIEQTLLVDMTPRQKELYDGLAASIANEMAHSPSKGKGNALMLEALLRLRQAACHPQLLTQDREDGSGKIDTLLAHLRELRGEGRKSLVFSQFTSLLDLVQPELDKAGVKWLRLDGSTNNREEVVGRFQSDLDCTVFLISLKAGGVGLNLTAADCVFILDPWWNPASESQAAARAHRIGQRKSVFVQRIISRGTVEEAIMAMKAEKQELTEALVQGGAGAASLNGEDLRALLQPAQD